MKTVKELQEQINAKRAELAKIFEEAKGDDGYKMKPEQVEDVRKRNEELTDLSKQLEEAREVDEIYRKNQEDIRNAHKAAKELPLGGDDEKPKTQQKSLGEMFVKSEGYKSRETGKDLVVDLPDFDVKTLMETTAGFAPESVRTGKVVLYAMRSPVVADLIPQTGTNQAAIVYMEETTFTNAADAIAEAAEYPEGALVYTERSETIRKIATFLPVTDEQLEDEPSAQALIDNRLVTMLKLEEEAELVSGSGSSPHLTGFLNKSGVQSQALGADPIPDAIYKAMTLVRGTGFAEPSGLIIHPNDWQTVRLLRTTDGLYIWGNPSEAGPERVWGLPAVITTAMTENTALTGDFPMFSELFRKRGITIKVSDSHSDYFIKGKQAIRADERIALVIYRASAFCKITGI